MKKLLGIALAVSCLSSSPLIADSRIVYADQGWNKADRDVFYRVPQGSMIVPSDIALALEKDDSEQLLLGDENILKLGYIPDNVSPLNPDGLPIGFTQEEIDGDIWLGLNCASCHLTEIKIERPRGNSRNRRDIIYRIDGSQGANDFAGLLTGILKALEATYNSPEKFNRLAERMLGSDANQGEVNQLFNRLEDSLERFANFMDSINISVEWGHGRADPVNILTNYFAGVLNPDQDVRDINKIGTDGPVNPPHLWMAAWLDFVEWGGFLANFPSLNNIGDPGAFLGPKSRNIIQAILAGAKLEITKNPNQLGYENSVNLQNQEVIEFLIRKLKSPRWPTRFFGRINRVQARQGAELYARYCVSCHSVVPRASELRPHNVVITPFNEVGTDPTNIEGVLRPLLSGGYEGRLELGVAGPEIGPTTDLLGVASNVVANVLVEALGPDISPELEEFNPFIRQEPAGYKATPLNGIWATAPYLHNGSVPNMYELLLPADERSETFYFGNRVYDPVNLGFTTSGEPDGIKQPFLIDTRIKGNWNTGHEYGTGMTHEDRMALIEYIKTL